MPQAPKKTVGLITLHLGTNFGSALQTFATYHAVEKAGHDCTLIDYMYPTSYHLLRAKRAETDTHATKISSFILIKIINILRTLKVFLTGKPSSYRNQVGKFETFLHTLKKTNVYDRQTIKRNPPTFDIYLTGSDQTWNPRYLHHDYSFLLEFAPDNAVKIAYAASFGAKKLLPAYHQSYVRLLKRYDKVSVREESGVHLFKSLTGRDDATCLLDPTFLLDREDWMTHVKNAKIEYSKPYILCYILSYVFNPYPEVLDVIEQVQKTTGYDVFFLGFHPAVAAKGYKIIFDAGPEDFLALYDNAAFIITTSFHGAAFSINFKKDFLAIINPNPSKDDRVVNILSLVGLKNRGIVLGSSIDPVLENMKVDYTTGAGQKVEELRSKSIVFLKEALAFEK